MPDPVPAAAARLSVRGISKAFPGVQALWDVGFEVSAGEIHALVGENGAGKSSLLKILSGVYRADAGEVRVDGVIVQATSPKSARAQGVAMIHQELQQVPRLDVAQNMFLGMPLTRAALFTDRPRMREIAREALAPLDPTIDVAAPIGTLQVGQRQIVEIARALLGRARIIAMDEPTSSLTPREFDRLVGVIGALSAQGVAVIYVSHKLEEVFRVASRATVLRDGRRVGDVSLAQSDEPSLVAMMVGRAIESRSHQGHAQGARVLEVAGLSRGQAVRDVTFSLQAGEVLGVAGLVGAGRTELMRLLAGVDRPTAGSVTAFGRALRAGSPRQAIAAGIALLPEERKRDGIVPLRPVLANVALPSFRRWSRNGVIRSRAVRRRVGALTASVALRPPGIDRAIRLYSGGNQQKAILCRWLMAEARILIFDEPTRGIDVGAKAEVHGLIEDLARQGRSVIVVSSEVSELLRLSDRVLVMRRGAMEGVVAGADLTEAAILRLAVSGA